MEIDRDDERNDAATRAEPTKPAGGIYSVPVIGSASAGVRRFYDDMAPQRSDSTEVRVAKHVLRWSSAVAGAAAVAVIVL